MARRKDPNLNRVHFMNSLDKDIYSEFRSNCDALERRYCDVHESILSEWNEKAKVEIEKRKVEIEKHKQKIERQQNLEADSQLVRFLRGRLADIDHRINSGLSSERDLKVKAETLQKIEELQRNISEGLEF